MTTKPEVLSRIEATFSQLTPSEKRVASWLLAHAAQIPFETAESVGLATGTSGITVGRFLRKLGYRNLEDAKKSLRDPHQPWGMNERLDSWQQQSPLPNRLQHSLSLEVDAHHSGLSVGAHRRISPGGSSACPRGCGFCAGDPVDTWDSQRLLQSS